MLGSIFHPPTIATSLPKLTFPLFRTSSEASAAAQLPVDYATRLGHVVDQSWLILKSRFLQRRHPIQLEAPFQHYFAHILAAYGDLCCTRREDLFLVDLECKQSDTNASREYIDIVCSFHGHARCAIELKFKTKKQAAQDHGRIDVYSDIEALERACRGGFTFGRFYMITDSSAYVNPSRKGVGTVFALHDGHQTTAGVTYHCPQAMGRETVKVPLGKSYQFKWERIDDWYFLALTVCP